MFKFASRLLLLITVFTGLAPALAAAVDIPVLTWERGRVQEVILGDMSTSTDWKLQLVGKNTTPVVFSQSSQNEAGYYVYSANIPADLPVGAYSLESSGGGLSKTIVAGINLVEAATYDIRTQSRDLTFVVGLFTFITVTLSSLRSRKYSRLVAIPQRERFSRVLDESKPVDRIIKKFVNLRKDLTQGVQPSLFRHLLGQESQFLLRFSKPMYFAFPLIAIAFGFFAGTNAEASGGLEKSSLLYFFIITVIGLVDSFSGIFGLFTFWAVQFFYGDVANVNQILIMAAAGIAWVGPSLAARIYQDAIAKDFAEDAKALPSNVRMVVSAFGSALAATAIFFGGYKLLISLMGEVSSGWTMKPFYVGVIFLIAMIKAVFNDRFASEPEVVENTKFEIVRVVSPQIAFALFTVTLGFAYIWTGSTLKALIASALFSAPYFLLFIRFEAIGGSFLAKVRRNILLESGLAVAASYIIYTQIQKLPQLSDQRAEIYLIAAAIPGLVHAIFSSICDSAQREERINP